MLDVIQKVEGGGWGETKTNLFPWTESGAKQRKSYGSGVCVCVCVCVRGFTNFCYIIPAAISTGPIMSFAAISAQSFLFFVFCFFLAGFFEYDY